jgi:mRNA interferase RelE/StbE
MTYELAFKVSALKEWKKLGHTVKEQFKRKLVERLQNPHVASAALAGSANLYKIKLRQAGYRLVYSVEDQIITVTVIAVGKRERGEVYELALARLRDDQKP